MCGIVGYCGKRNASEIIYKGLKQLEYRGYDSAGIAVVSDGTVSAVIDAVAFEGYDLLIALVASAVGVSGACFVILTAFSIKLRRVRDEG